MTISADTSEVNALFSDLEERAEVAARPAAQAASQVLYTAVQRNVAGIGRVSGNLGAVYALREGGSIHADDTFKSNIGQPPKICD